MAVSAKFGIWQRSFFLHPLICVILLTSAGVYIVYIVHFDHHSPAPQIFGQTPKTKLPPEGGKIKFLIYFLQGYPQQNVKKL